LTAMKTDGAEPMPIARGEQRDAVKRRLREPA